MKSAFLWIILVGFGFTAINSQNVINTLSFDSCQNDSWRIRDVSYEQDGDETNVVVDIGYGKESGNVIHQVRMTLTGCEGATCSNVTDVSVADIDCDGVLLSDLDIEACGIAQALAEWQLEAGESDDNQTISDLDGTCVHYNGKDLSREFIDDVDDSDVSDLDFGDSDSGDSDYGSAHVFVDESLQIAEMNFTNSR